MKDNKLQVVGEQGEITNADVLLHYKNNANNKEYVLYTFHELDEQSMETIHASALVLDGDNYKYNDVIRVDTYMKDKEIRVLRMNDYDMIKKINEKFLK